VSCIKIGAQEFKILVFDVLAKKIVWRKVFTCDFKVFDNSGVIVNPSQVATFIQNIFQQYGLPKKARVCLSLEYLSINNLLLPAISGAEFHQIILDEAAHESVYSFTDEKVAVAYQILKDKINQNGIVNTEVFAVTTLQTAINQVVEVFNNTNIVLESIAPSLWGLKQYLTQYLTSHYKPIVVILVASADTEFYLWKGQFPYSSHHIKAGLKTPEKLQTEIIASLEHFNKPVVGEELFSQVVVVGEKCELQLGDNYKIDYIFEDEWPDLLGLALISKDSPALNFITNHPKASFALAASMNKFWPIVIASLVCLNMLIGWNLWSSGQHLEQIKNEYLRLQNSVIIKAQQLNMAHRQPVGARFNVDVLLEKMRGIVTEDMIFDKLALDLENKNMQVEGFCLSQKNLNVFLMALSQLKDVKSVDEIESSQQKRADLMGYAFRCKVTFLGDFSHDE
jgi:hypothetical protein